MVSDKRVRNLGSIHLLYTWVILLLSLSVTQAQEALNLEQVARYGQGRLIGTTAWSPDGTTLAVGGTRGVWFYDATNLQAEPEFLDIGYSSQLAYAPDGRLAVTVSRAVMVLDTDRNVLTTFEGNGAAWSRDGALLALYTDSDVFVLDAQTWDERYHLPFTASSSIYSLVPNVTFSGDGRLLFLRYSINHTPAAAVWELGADSSTPLETYFDNPDLQFMDIFGLAPDGVTLALTTFFNGNSFDSVFRFFNIETHAVVEESAQYPLGAAFSPDGRTLVTWITVGRVTLWDVNPWAERRRFDDTGVPAFNPDGSLLALGHGVYDTETDRRVLIYSVPTTRYTASPDGMTILERSDELRLLDAVTGESYATISGVESPLNYTRFSPDGRWLLTWHDDMTVYLWDARTGVQQAQIWNGDGIQRYYDFSPDGTLLVMVGASYNQFDSRFGVWDLVDNRRILLPTGAYVRSDVAFTAQSEVVLMSGTNDISLWQPRTNQITPTAHLNYRPVDLTISDDVSLLAYTDFNDITLFDVTSATEITHIDLPDDLLGANILRFSTDNAYLFYSVTFSEIAPSEVYVWDIERGEIAVEPPAEERIFVAQSERWGVVLNENVLQLYAADAALDAAPLAEIPRFGVEIERVALSPDGTYLLIGYEDGVVIVWRLG